MEYFGLFIFLFVLLPTLLFVTIFTGHIAVHYSEKIIRKIKEKEWEYKDEDKSDV